MPCSKYNYEMTAYPEIFRKTYWGAFKFDTNDYEDICQRRNEFIEMYNIKDCKTTVRFTRRFDGYFKGLDHGEIYQTNDKKYILVCSVSSKIRNNNEWIPYHNLYRSGWKTYIRLFEK